MSIRQYEQWKYRYDNTKPIRGRAVECRPWGERRRDHEQITRTLTPMGEGYTAKLYETDVVTLCPNGDFYIKADKWATYMTAEWIRYRTPFSAYKKHSRLWVDVNGSAYPIGRDTVLHVKYDKANDRYYCDKEVVMTQKVVDRTKSKQVRETIQPFRAYAKMMMSLADGWLSHETLEQHKKFTGNTGWRNSYEYKIADQTFSTYMIRGGQMYTDTANKLLGLMQKFHDLSDEEKFRLLIVITEGMEVTEHRLLMEIDRESEYNGQKHTWKEKVYENRFDPKRVVSRVDYIMKKASDIYTTREVKVTKPKANLM